MPRKLLGGDRLYRCGAQDADFVVAGGERRRT